MNLTLAAVGLGMFVAWHILMLLDGQAIPIGTVAAADLTLLSAGNRANLLAHFVRSVKHAEPAFEWIREQSAIVDGVSRHKRDAFHERARTESKWSEWNDGAAGLDDDDGGDEVSGELWYNRFRETECDGNNGAYCSSFRGETVQAQTVIADGKKDTGVEDVNWYETYKNYGNNITLADVWKTTDVDGKLEALEKEQNAPKSSNTPIENEKTNINFTPDDKQPDIVSRMETQQNDNMFEHQRTYRDLQDQVETTRNDLSHEARYKLSKYEQDHVRHNRSFNRQKRSIPHVSHKGHAMEILSGSLKGFSPKLLSTLVKNSREDGDYEEEVFDDEVENVTTENPLPESIDLQDIVESSTEKPKKNCTRKTIIGSNISHPIMTGMHDAKKGRVHVNKNNDANAITENVRHEHTKQRVGITLEVKINNVTRQRIQTLDDLRRRKKDTHSTKTKQKEIDNETIDDIVSGKLPNRLVSAVFEMVRSNDRMKEIIRPLVNINDNVPVFNEKSQNARSKLKANGLLSQIMTSMNDIIRDQVREQTCVTLRPDLQRYVDDIRDFYEQERIDNGHGKDDADVDDVYAIGSNSHSKTPKRNSKPKRQAIDTDVTTSEHFDYDTFTRICNHVTINEKYALIIGLLEQYERLGDSDRLQVIVQKRYLEDHLHLLDELEMFVHRQNAAKRFKKDAREEKRSGRFEKLVRTAETIRKNAMIVDDDDAWVGFDTEHETNFDD